MEGSSSSSSSSYNCTPFLHSLLTTGKFSGWVSKPPKKGYITYSATKLGLYGVSQGLELRGSFQEVFRGLGFRVLLT